MAQQDTVFSGSIPLLYDRYIGPALMAPYARDLTARLSTLQTGTVLETAAGTGIVTEALAQGLPGVSIVATDLNQPMLDHAAAKPALSRVRFRQADAGQLPFDDERFDALVCQFGVMFFPDLFPRQSWQGCHGAIRSMGPGSWSGRRMDIATRR